MQVMSNNSSLRNLIVAVAVLLLAGCATLFRPQQEHRAASVVDYLYPNASEAPQLQAGTTTLRPPVRVGIARWIGLLGAAVLAALAFVHRRHA